MFKFELIELILLLSLQIYFIKCCYSQPTQHGHNNFDSENSNVNDWLMMGLPPLPELLAEPKGEKLPIFILDAMCRDLKKQPASSFSLNSIEDMKKIFEKHNYYCDLPIVFQSTGNRRGSDFNPSLPQSFAMRPNLILPVNVPQGMILPQPFVVPPSVQQQQLQQQQLPQQQLVQPAQAQAQPIQPQPVQSQPAIPQLPQIPQIPQIPQASPSPSPSAPASQPSASSGNAPSNIVSLFYRPT